MNKRPVAPANNQMKDITSGFIISELVAGETPVLPAGPGFFRVGVGIGVGFCLSEWMMWYI
jgi:hypothetical protein